MTDRISHEEALRALNVPWDTTRLRAYITQQQAAEANTVSRAEHEAVLDRVLGQRESEHDSRITALQAEHEAALEALEDGLRTELRGANEECAALQAEHYDVVNRWSLKLSAAEARVAELEAELRIAWEDEPASPPPAVAGGAVSGAELLDAVAGRPVAEASVQPAPGGVERCTCSYSGDVPGKHAGHARSCPMHADPTPADQPHPAYWREDEDSSLDLHIRQREASSPDYVTYDVLIEVLRESHYDGLANRLEKARKS